MDRAGGGALAERRSGATRGFLFADLRGYTAFLELRGATAAAALLRRYRDLVRAAVAEGDGAEIRTEGDSFYVVFPDASAAVRCGLAIAERAARASAADPSLPVHVGIGVHAGETVETSEGFVGSAVNLAARLCSSAAAGEVLVSDTVRALTRGVAPVHYESRGRLRFKGISERVAVYRVIPEGSTAAQRRRPARWLAGVVGGVLVAGLLAALVLGNGLVRDGAAFRGAPSDASAERSPPGGFGTASPGSSGLGGADRPFPTDAERDLLTLVDERYRPTCDRAVAGTAPVIAENIPNELGGGSGRRAVAFAAGIVCSPFGLDAPDELAYWVISDWWLSGADEVIYNRAGIIGAPSRSCSEERPALEEWQAGPISGRLLCNSTTSLGAILSWTYAGTDVLGRATRADGDMEVLLAWWSEDPRFRRP
jgi:class 3 adenylate cyclase